MWGKKGARQKPVASNGEGTIDGVAGAGSGARKRKWSPEKRKTMMYLGMTGLAVIAIGYKVIEHRDALAAHQNPSSASAIALAGGTAESNSNSIGGAIPLPPAQTSAVTQKTSSQPMQPMQPMQPTANMPTTVQAGGNLSQIQQVMAAASGNTVTVLQTWPGPGPFTGVIYRDVNGSDGIAWVDPQAQLVSIGTLIGANGQNFNNSADFAMNASDTGGTRMPTAPATPDSTGEATLSTLINQGTDFVVGSAGPEITVYLDPNSTKSHTLYMALEKSVNAGKLRVRYVLVAMKNQGSLKRAEQILAAPSPAKELSKDERLFHKRANGQDSGGIRGINGNLAMTQIVDANTALLANAGYMGQPDIVYCNKSGQKQIAIGNAAIGDLSAILPTIGVCA